MMSELTQADRRVLNAQWLDDNEAKKPKKKEKAGWGHHGYTSLSYACAHNNHKNCAAKKCECECGHESNE